MKSLFAISLGFISWHCLIATRVDNGREKIAHNVTIPKFGDDGELICLLMGQRVKMMNNKPYDVWEPNLKFFSSNHVKLKIWSDFGCFDFQNGIAKGNSPLFALGDGFMAEGNKWIWREGTNLGLNHISLLNGGTVSFDPDFSNGQRTSHVKLKRSHEKLSNALDKNETSASADIIEFLELGGGDFQFNLEGNVSILGNELEIECSKMEIMVVKDHNSTEGDLGEISEIKAWGNVLMIQRNRTCRANIVILDTQDGSGFLEGNATVEDSNWGVVKGNKIVLDKKSGRASVVGNSEQRPKIEFPNAGRFPLPSFAPNKIPQQEL